MAEFEPTIIAFCCNYCAYAAADLAGSMRMRYPTNIKVIRLPCSGRAELQEIMDAFVKGADGVLVIGCEPGDCHFLEGNFKAKKRVPRAKQLLEEAGVEPERVEFFHNSAADGPQLADIFITFTDKIRAMGPNPAYKPTTTEKEEVHA